MPEYVLHEYSPFRDSSDLGPADWATLARDIKANYLHFDGFVIITGTDTMAYCATVRSSSFCYVLCWLVGWLRFHIFEKGE